MGLMVVALVISSFDESVILYIVHARAHNGLLRKGEFVVLDGFSDLCRQKRRSCGRWAWATNAIESSSFISEEILCVVASSLIRTSQRFLYCAAFCFPLCTPLSKHHFSPPDV
jgi:hypothetical protein